MRVAYKYCILQNGLMVVCEDPLPKEALDRSSNGISIEVVQDQNDVYLCVGETHAIPLIPDILDALSRTKRLILAVSGLFERRISVSQTVEIDDVMFGRLMAYVEIARTALEDAHNSSAASLKTPSAAVPAPSAAV